MVPCQLLPLEYPGLGAMSRQGECESPGGARPSQMPFAHVEVEERHLFSPEKGVEKQRLSWQGRGCFSEHALAQGLLCLSRGLLPNS